MKSHWVIFTPILLMILISACGSTPSPVGILEGHVTIGPLVPAVKEGVPAPTPAPEVYAARQIVVLRERDGKEIARLEIDSSGYYQGELPAGTYQVDINHLGIDSAMGFPKTVEIHPHQTTRVDVEIDTGIR